MNTLECQPLRDGEYLGITITQDTYRGSVRYFILKFEGEKSDDASYKLYRVSKSGETCTLETDEDLLFMVSNFTESERINSVAYQNEVITWGLFVKNTSGNPIGEFKILGRFPRKTNAHEVAVILLDDLDIMHNRTLFVAAPVDVESLKAHYEYVIENAVRNATDKLNQLNNI